MNDRYKAYIILMVIVFCLMAISAFANLVVYVIHWEDETEWTEVRTYGQKHMVYIEFESSLGNVQAFQIPAEFAGLLGSHIQRAALDANHHQDISGDTEVQ